MNKIEKGKLGEKLAQDFLLKKNYKILERNYRNKIGEIDLIALDKDLIVFVEVKTRTSSAFGYAYEAVDWKKQRKIIQVSSAYLNYKKIRNQQIRYDIVEVYLKDGRAKINHIENAFQLG